MLLPKTKVQCQRVTDRSPSYGHIVSRVRNQKTGEIVYVVELPEGTFKSYVASEIRELGAR